LLASLAGIFMGLSIFTKLPAIAIAPAVGFLVYQNTKAHPQTRNKAIIAYMLPMILIPMIWPIHALSIGQFDEWKDGLVFQMDREDQPLYISLGQLFKIDPVLMALAAAGIAYAAMRRDYFLLLWVLPLLALLQIVGYVSFFHLVPLFPVFCITAAVLLQDLSGRIKREKRAKAVLIGSITAISGFGLVATTLLISQDLTASYFELSSIVSRTIPDGDDSAEKTTVIGNLRYFWIPKYVLDKDENYYQTYYSWLQFNTNDAIIISDAQFRRQISGIDGDLDWNQQRLLGLYENTKTIETIKETAFFREDTYPYTGNIHVEGIGNVEILSNNLRNIPSTEGQMRFFLEPIFRGIEFPTSMAFLGPSDILVLEKNKGTVNRIINGTMLPEPLLDVNVATVNERGMLGIAVSKNNQNNVTYVFLYYTEAATRDGDDMGRRLENGTTNAPVEPLGNRLYRYELVGGKLDNPKLLLDLPAYPGPSHNGGALAIGPDGNIYLTIGDLLAREGKVATAATNLIGSTPPDGRAGVLRVTQDGQAVGPGIFGKEEPLNKYYAYGIRNSFGIAFDPVTGNLWETENGPSFGDEINLVEPGFNSGWKKVQGVWEVGPVGNQGVEVTSPSELVTFNGTEKYSNPEFMWNASTGLTAIQFINSEIYGQGLRNDLLVADFNFGNIYHFDLDQSRTGLVLNGEVSDRIASNSSERDNLAILKAPGGITEMEMGPDGYIYLLALGAGGGGDCEPGREKCVDYDSSSVIGGVFRLDFSNSRLG
jgi:glucose/arabinose dehydrogenase